MLRRCAIARPDIAPRRSGFIAAASDRPHTTAKMPFLSRGLVPLQNQEAEYVARVDYRAANKTGQPVRALVFGQRERRWCQPDQGDRERDQTSFKAAAVSIRAAVRERCQFRSMRERERKKENLNLFHTIRVVLQWHPSLNGNFHSPGPQGPDRSCEARPPMLLRRD